MNFKRLFVFWGANTWCIFVSRGVELLMRVQMGFVCVHEGTSHYRSSRADSNTACPACGQNVESLSHLVFYCPATSAQIDTVLNDVRSVLRQVAGPAPGGAEKVRDVLALTDASTKLLRFVSDDFWGSKGVFERYLAACLRIWCKLGMW
jgi:hypothetical protein